MKPSSLPTKKELLTSSQKSLMTHFSKTRTETLNSRRLIFEKNERMIFVSILFSIVSSQSHLTIAFYLSQISRQLIQAIHSVDQFMANMNLTTFVLSTCLQSCGSLPSTLIRANHKIKVNPMKYPVADGLIFYLATIQSGL